jgi:predicted regulator of Ras-like GTPase activity (Roadblock/LC7/MglB family)
VETILRQLNSVPGVVGSLVCDAGGHLRAHAFPAVFDPALLRKAARLAPDGVEGLEPALGKMGTLDLRYNEARILLQRRDHAILLVLCAPDVSATLLNMSASVALGRLGQAAAGWSEQPPPAALTPPPAPPAAARPPSARADARGQLFRLVRRIDEIIARRRLDGFKIRGQIAIQAGFGLGFIDANTPDDPTRADRLRAAATAVLGEPL